MKDAIERQNEEETEEACRAIRNVVIAAFVVAAVIVIAIITLF